MTNEAAERLLEWVEGDAETRNNFRFRVDEALAAERLLERQATVERIRERLLEHDGSYNTILDEEAAR